MKFDNETSTLQQKMTTSDVGVQRRQAMLKAMQINISEKIIDIGCGGGHLVEEIAKSVGVQGKVIGLDPSSSQIDSAKDRCKDLTNTEFLCSSANKIKLEDNSIDTITSTQTLEYIRDVDTTLIEIKRISKNKSKFFNISTLWDFYRFHGPEQKLNDLIHNVFKDHCYHQMLPTILNGKLNKLGYTNIKTHELAFVFTQRNQNSFATFAEIFLANFALGKGVEKEKVTEWRRQIKKAEGNGSFCFTAIPILTEAYLEK